MEGMKNTSKKEVCLNEINGKLKQKFALMDNEDLLIIEDKKKELIERLQLTLGKTKEEVLRLIYD
jgi:hypothetical protein